MDGGVLVYWLIVMGVYAAREGQPRALWTALWWPYYLGKALAARYLA